MLSLPEVGINHSNSSNLDHAFSNNLKINVAKVRPAAGNKVCLHYRSGYNGIIKNQVFSFAYTLLFLPDFP